MNQSTEGARLAVDVALREGSFLVGVMLVLLDGESLIDRLEKILAAKIAKEELSQAPRR